MTKQRKDRGDGRDEKGRWVKSGNPDGRPKKESDFDMSDYYNFSNAPIETTVAGKKYIMTRHEALMAKIFESAMKGCITSQRFLLEKFEEADLSRKTVRLKAIQLTERHCEDPDSVSIEELRLVDMAANALQVRRTPLRTRNGKRSNRKKRTR